VSSRNVASSTDSWPSSPPRADRASHPLRQALAESWARETSADPDGWSSSNPAWGQCAVTALIVQDFLGGELLRCRVDSTSHYWNRLPSGQELDLTGHQFGDNFTPGRRQLRSRDYVLSFPETVERYHRLLLSTRLALGRKARKRAG
jgi:hypothetical protein